MRARCGAAMLCPMSTRLACSSAWRLLLILLLLLHSAPVAASEAQLGEEPPPTDVDEVKSGFDKKGVPRGRARLQAFRRRVLPEWLHESHLDLHFRSYYLEHAEDGDPEGFEKDRGAWAYGGWLQWRSPWWWNRIQLEAAGFTTQRLWGQERKDGTRLLAPGQDGFSVAGIANLKVRHGEDDVVLTLYRQHLDLPFLNRQDSRMVPNTFEAATLQGALERWDYFAGWVWRMKERDSDEFRSMEEVAGADGTERGLGVAGVRWRASDRFEVGFVDQYLPDLLNTFYAAALYRRSLERLHPDLDLLVEGQYTDQRSVGDDLLGVFETYRVGLRVVASVRGTALGLALAWTDDDHGIESPFGSDPSFLSTMQDDFERAGDRVVLFTWNQDFERFGLPHVKSALNVAIGRNRLDVDGGRGGNRHAVETTIDYRVPEGRLEGFWVRTRASYLDDGPVDSFEFRLILNYDLPVF